MDESLFVPKSYVSIPQKSKPSCSDIQHTVQVCLKSVASTDQGNETDKYCLIEKAKDRNWPKLCWGVKLADAWNDWESKEVSDLTGTCWPMKRSKQTMLFENFKLVKDIMANGLFLPVHENRTLDMCNTSSLSVTFVFVFVNLCICVFVFVYSFFCVFVHESDTGHVLQLIIVSHWSNFIGHQQ